MIDQIAAWGYFVIIALAILVIAYGQVNEDVEPPPDESEEEVDE